MIINKKTVSASEALRQIQKADRNANRSFAVNFGSVLHHNINKVVKLSSEEPIGDAVGTPSTCKVEFDSQKLISALSDVGLTGQSGSGFPVAEKLKTFLMADKVVTYIVINGCECEPSLVHDAWLMRNRMEDIEFGAKVLKDALKIDNIILATRGKAEYSVKRSTFAWKKLPYRFPMGEEHFLIRQALGIKLDFNSPPAKEGILVLNVQTVYQIGRIANGSYDGGRFVTLANLKTGEARVAYTHLGDRILPLLEKVFDVCDEIYYAGGGVGSAFPINGESVIDKFTSFASVMDKALLPVEQSCKKCGSCMRKCPMHIPVAKAVLKKQADPNADVSMINADRCIGCGTCAYFCPAGKNAPAFFSRQHRTIAKREKV